MTWYYDELIFLRFCPPRCRPALPPPAGCCLGAQNLHLLRLRKPDGLIFCARPKALPHYNNSIQLRRLVPCKQLLPLCFPLSVRCTFSLVEMVLRSTGYAEGFDTDALRTPNPCYSRAHEARAAPLLPRVMFPSPVNCRNTWVLLISSAFI